MKNLIAKVQMNTKYSFILTAAVLVTSAFAIGITSVSKSAEAATEQYCYKGTRTFPDEFLSHYSCFDSKKECQESRNLFLKSEPWEDETNRSASQCKR
jgi:hypothetical protein